MPAAKHSTNGNDINNAIPTRALAPVSPEPHPAHPFPRTPPTRTSPPHPSVDEIHAEKVQHQTPKHKVRKRPLIAETALPPLLLRIARKLPPIRRVRLHAQTGRQDELAHRRGEARQEGVEGLWNGQPFEHVSDRSACRVCAGGTRGNEGGGEGKGEGAHIGGYEQAVQELHGADDGEEAQECVDDFDARGCVGLVVVLDLGEDVGEGFGEGGLR